jgi:hypothetical protein
VCHSPSAERTPSFPEDSYDRDGNQLTETTCEDGTTTERTRSMTYDKLNRVTYEALPGGGSNS